MTPAPLPPLSASPSPSPFPLSRPPPLPFPPPWKPQDHHSKIPSTAHHNLLSPPLPPSLSQTTSRKRRKTRPDSDPASAFDSNADSQDSPPQRSHSHRSRRRRDSEGSDDGRRRKRSPLKKISDDGVAEYLAKDSSLPRKFKKVPLVGTVFKEDYGRGRWRLFLSWTDFSCWTAVYQGKGSSWTIFETSKCLVDEVLVDKRQKRGNDSVV